MKSTLCALVLSLAVSPLIALPAAPLETNHAAGARLLPIAGDAFAGTSVNVVSGLQNSLFTDGRIQFAAFYAADGALVLGRRTIGTDTWETRRTAYTGRTHDAHNTVALVVDGAGFLHVAWDHHGNKLNYARGIAPGSLELGPPQAMTGQLEEKVTYPAFLRTPGGDLLFFYRNGASGQGDLVLNRYTTAAGTWKQVHAKLLDGEGKRSAYPSFTIDGKGTIHLAWVWRETPDVSTNHDIAYARSTDGGVTWTTSTGAALTTPITAAGAEYAVRIPEGRSLMNPPAISADSTGRPFITNYWAPEGSDIPQYHLVRPTSEGWRVQQITRRTTPFKLAGTSTKRPPLSRSVVLVESPWRKPTAVFVIYRDDERDERAVVASCRDIDAKDASWTFADLTRGSVGAWEPSIDPEQWRRLQQAHLLLQNVVQRDGDDRKAADVAPSTIGSLIWSPFLAGLAENRAAHRTAPLPTAPAGVLERPIVAAEVLALLERATDWQLAAPYEKDPRGWVIAPFYIGALEVARISPAPRFQEALAKRFAANKWAPAPKDYYADDYCVVQAYAELARRTGDKTMLAPSVALFDRILAKPPTTPLDWGTPRSQDRWSWCDALFMGPSSWLDVHLATGDKRLLDYANKEWWVTTDTLFVPSDGFYARDESYLDLREPNGRRLYWSRGNGWVAAGLARVLARFPRDHADYARYVQLYHTMMEAVLAAQQPDGLWRPGLLDADAHRAVETSGSSFYTFAMAWGVNHGVLDRARFEPAVRRAWNALTASVRADGKVENVQPIGAAPEGFDPTHTEPFGVGAFLLAGAEVHDLVTGNVSPVLNKP